MQVALGTSTPTSTTVVDTKMCIRDRTRAKALEKLGITTLRDLISYFPRSYEDRTLTRPIRDLTEGENVCVRAMIAADPTAHRIPGGRTIVRTRAVDETGALDIVF